MPNRKQSAMEKPKNFGASIAFVWSYLRRRKPLLFLAGLMVLFNIGATLALSLIHISEPTRQAEISYAVFCLKKKKKKKNINTPTK